MTLPKIAVPGPGNMGAGIALSILRSGRTVIVWNRSPGRCRESPGYPVCTQHGGKKFCR